MAEINCDISELELVPQKRGTKKSLGSLMPRGTEEESKSSIWVWILLALHCFTVSLPNGCCVIVSTLTRVSGGVLVGSVVNFFNMVVAVHRPQSMGCPLQLLIFE